jgi:Protein of unknown function (DUF4232)
VYLGYTPFLFTHASPGQLSSNGLKGHPMNLTTSAAWRFVAAAAATCAAILVPVSALAAPRPAAIARAAVAPRCATADLKAWLGLPGDGAAGSSYYELELSNTSSHACTLFGFPGVSAMDAHGQQLGSAAGRDHADVPHVVTFGRGATAHVLLRIVNTGILPGCHPAAAAGLKIYPPDDTASVLLPFSFSACTRHGPVYLYVRAAVSGAGIPGFSS